MKKPKKQHPVDKEIKETEDAMTEGFPKEGAEVIRSQIDRCIRMAFQLGYEYAVRNPELAKDWLAKNKRKTRAKNRPMKDEQP